MSSNDDADVRLAFEDALPPDVPHAAKRLEICDDYQRGHCPRGEACPLRHVISSFRTVQTKVCKHWLRGACVNGDNCLYLHEYDNRFVPVCAFYERLGECANPECPFVHTTAPDRQPECAAYRRGFCPLGPACRLRHRLAREVCVFYMAGFCPLGPRCPRAHPVQELHDRASVSQRILARMLVERARDPTFNRHATCFRAGCLDPGHMAPQCPGPQHSQLRKHLAAVQEPGEDASLFEDEVRGTRRCFLCHEEGHTIRNCPRNPRAQQQQQQQQQQQEQPLYMQPPSKMPRTEQDEYGVY